MSRDLTFNANTPTQTVEIPTTGDMVLEMSESFSLSLSQMPVDTAVILNPASTTINIQDDDSKLMNNSLHFRSDPVTSSQFPFLFSCYNRIR